MLGRKMLQRYFIGARELNITDVEFAKSNKVFKSLILNDTVLAK